MREVIPVDLGGWSNPGGTILIEGTALQMRTAERDNKAALACKKLKSGIQRVTNV